MIISLPDITIVSQIYQSKNTVVYRGIIKASQQPLILKLLNKKYPANSELQRYQQEYEITRHLDLEGVIKAYELRKYQNTLFMVLEDFGGDSLNLLLKNRFFSLSEVLKIAIKITDTLGEIHHQNIIHKNINPSNIIFNPKTGQLKIIDFGISQVVSPEKPLLKNSPNIPEETLAYISPEQTGRMNRVIDYRTDFYSLGVTFYQLLTNQLPFQAEDTLELVHCHLAKKPVPPQEINRKIPLPVSEIVMKLMAKMAEERYQSSYGLKVDLETCLEQHKNKNGKIQPFILGKKDVSPQLQLSSKLYGRELQLEILLKVFVRVSSGENNPVKEDENNPSIQPETQQLPDVPRKPTGEFILISGYSGIGKSTLVGEFYKLIPKKRGYFICGKFDPLHRDIPYQALIIAFQELVRQLLTETEFQLQQWRDKILLAVGTNGQILIDIIPELELIIGSQPSIPELPPTEAENRLNLVFKQFIQVFCQQEHPLVLFLDDLQWTDTASLKLLQLLITQPNHQYLFLIGAYRDNEVSATHPLILTLSEMEQQGVVINNISLSPLNVIQVNQLVADTLKTLPIHTQKLAELVWIKTRGNPFFIQEFLKSLLTEKLLEYNRKEGKWNWNLEKIQARNITDNVVELISDRMKNLSESTQEILQLAACLGNKFELEFLAIINETTLQKTATELEKAVQAGLIISIGDDYKFLKIDPNLNNLRKTYKFVHDRIQQAAYSLIKTPNKKAVHWKIGRLLWENTPSQMREKKIFDIVNQLNLGLELITLQSERDFLAELNRIAAKKAKASAAWKSALNYLRIGINCLGAESWVRQYDLTLTLYVEAAESASLTGNFEEMKTRISAVLKQANSLLDKVKVYEIKIQYYTAQNQPLKAIETALSVLKILGIRFPKNPNKLDILLGLVRSKLTCAGKKIEDLINLPEMTDPYKLAAMRILSQIASPAHFAAPELLPLIVLKQVNLSVKYGNTSLSSCAYATYGLILSGEIVGDIETGYQFGQLALLLVDKFNAKELKARTLLIVNYFIKHWKDHLKETLTPLREAYTIGLETGDLEYAAYSACVYCYHSYVLGKELTTVEREMAMYAQTLSQLQQKTAFDYNQLNRQVVLNLMGRAEYTCCLRGESYDETEMLSLHLETQAANLCHSLYFYKLVLCYLFQNYQQALENARLVEQSSASAVGTIPLSHFYNSLVHMAIYFDVTKSEQKRILQKVKSNQKPLKKWARYAPQTHLHKFYLVEAERYRVLGEKVKAIECYDRAITLAKENEYLNEEALANELAAKFYLAWGKDKIAGVYLTDAYYCYQRWGATAKVKDLERRYPQFFQSVTTHNNSSKDTQNRLSNNFNSMLDLAALMKASQAIYSEIELDKLLTTLMNILLSNSGAETGYLILESQGQLRVEASGDANSDEVRVLQSIPIENCLPLSIINYVARTQESLVFSDAINEIKNINLSGDEADRTVSFDGDAYVQIHQCKSILCAPLLDRGQLTGIIYLENNVASGVFTPERLEVIKLLSTQAAIAVTNAKLYTEVRISENRLHKFLDAIPTGISVHHFTGKMVYSNQFASRLMNLKDFPAVDGISQVDTQENDSVIQRLILRSLEGEQARVDDLQVHQGEDILSLEAVSTPIFNQQGTVEYAITTFQDITQRKRAEKILENYNKTLEIQVAQRTAEWVETNLRLEAEIANRKQVELALRQSEARYLGIIEDQTELIVRYLPDGTLTFVNEAYCRFFGVKREEIIGKNYAPVVFEEDREFVRKQVNSIDKNNPVISFENRVIVAGEVRWMQWINRGIFDENVQIVEYQAVGRDISKRKKTEVLLAQAKEAAEAANQAKSAFLANMSHELRTPLNVILGFSRLMIDDTNLSEEQQENLNIICRSGEHLLSLINQVLALSKIEAGKETLNESNFNLYALLIELEDMFSLKAKEKGLRLSFDWEGNVPQYIRTDEGKLKQVLINLLNNAVKFTQTGSVSLKVAVENSRLIFEVSDTGVGIIPEQFEQLFKPFVQTYSSQYVQEGTGLGLAICWQFVRLMGGEITVISHGKSLNADNRILQDISFDEYREGTTFKFNIPARICDENEVEKLSKNRRVIGLMPNQPSYRILVVEDKDENRKLLVKVLANLGFELKEASNGEEAVEIWQSWEPHLIWMDMRMPVMDGYEATKRIKATTKGKTTAIIAITASVLEEEKAAILSTGCDDFVQKPFQEQMIFEMMEKYLGIHYVYENLELDFRRESVAEEPVNFTSLLTAMSNQWIFNLHEASLDADSTLVSQLVEEIPSSYLRELQTLRTWVKRFEFEKFLDLTEPLIEEE